MVGGPSLRLALLLAALFLVIGAMVRLDRPETQRALGSVMGATQQGPLGAAPGRPLVGADVLRGVEDNSPFRSAEQPAWFATLAAARDAESMPAPLVGYAALNTQPDVYRGKAVAVAGSVRRVERVEPAENDAGIHVLWRCTIAPAGGEVWPLTVYTLEEPDTPDPPYEAEAVGVFFKKLSYRWAEGMGITPVVVARRLAPPGAHAACRGSSADDSLPAESEEPDAEFAPPGEGSLGLALLADLGVDTQRLEQLVDKQPLTAADAAPFYEVIGAVSATPPAQLARLARAGLPGYAQRHTAGPAQTLTEAQVEQAVREAEADGRYSVVPLFLDAPRQRGELVLLDALVRRVVRVDASPSQAAADHGVDHYFEVEAFTDDSQNLPVVFCVRELPPGMPVGEDLEQPARLAGFFFKQWAYRVREPRDDARGDRRQFAPLLIGRAPLLLATPDATRGRPGLGVGLVASAALLVVVAWRWRQSLSDGRYERSTLRRYRAPNDGVDAERLGELAQSAQDASG